MDASAEELVRITAEIDEQIEREMVEVQALPAGPEEQKPSLETGKPDSETMQ